MRGILSATQHVVRLDLEDPHYTYPMLCKREEDRFESRNASAHGLTEHDGRGLVTLDYDRDGPRSRCRALPQRSGRLRQVGQTGNSIAFRVADAAGATSLSAEVTVSGAGDLQTVLQTRGPDFLSQELRVNHISLCGYETVDQTVRWTDDTKRTFEDIDADQQVRITPSGPETVTRYEEPDK